MDLQELTAIWNNTNQELDNNVQLNKKMLKELTVQKVRSQLNSIKWNNIIEIVLNFIFFTFLLNFSFAHFDLFLKFVLPALMLMVFSVFSIIFCISQLVLFYKIDSSTPVLETQKRIEKLKYYETLEHNALYVIIPLFWTAFLIVISKAFFNYDIFQLDGWLIGNFIGSIVIAIIVVFFLKKFPNENLKKSLLFLQQIKDLEQED